MYPDSLTEEAEQVHQERLDVYGDNKTSKVVSHDCNCKCKEADQSEKIKEAIRILKCAGWDKVSLVNLIDAAIKVLEE